MVLAAKSRSSCPEVFLRKDVLKICTKVTAENPCRSAKQRNNASKATLLKLHFGMGVLL